MPVFFFAPASMNIFVPHEHVTAAHKVIDCIAPHLRDLSKARQWTFKDAESYRLATSRLIGRGFLVEEINIKNSHRVFEGELAMVRAKKRNDVHTNWSHVGR